MSEPSTSKPPPTPGERKRQHSPDHLADAVIKIQVKNATTFRGRTVESEKVEAGGFPWQLIATIERAASRIDYLSLQLECNNGNKSNMWSAEAKVRLVVVNQEDHANDDVHEQEKVTFNFESSLGEDILPWRRVLDPTKGFIKDDTVHIEAHITINRTNGGVRKMPLFDFSQPSELTDVCLIIQEKQVHVGKQYLAMCSPVFKTMFFGNYDEKTKTEIELHDVEHAEFLELLHTVYPSQSKVTAENVESLLSLADRFEITMVTNMAENFLMKEDSSFTKCQLLVLADRYRLVQLQDRCLTGIEKVQNIRALKDTDDWCKLSETAKVALLERILSFRE
ncbi:hypothetical protein PFISCL1PPCAC_20912 [Pristionchus fissidentatus]|uniref:BTB domain-containing protein n=1 Tax=Pristionchus fissidentatus TaxID=1538716 RepID=A0AAV5WD65_9BILA|nr:hypothetical protein PFISCL1PPCAC_20912 [Pristionchus fissidentatus]